MTGVEDGPEREFDRNREWIAVDGATRGAAVSGGEEVIPIAPDEDRAETVTENHQNGVGELPDRLNQSLERIEMNSLEVKHYLDSIEQRISRMEPRLEELKPVEAQQPRAAETAVGGGTGQPGAAEVSGDWGDAVAPGGAVGPTTERRRRHQGFAVERRRAPFPAPDPPTRNKSERWSRGMFDLRRHKGGMLHRWWIPMAAFGTSVLAGVAFWSAGHHQPAAPSTKPGSVDAGPVLTEALPDGRQKGSADVPFPGDRSRVAGQATESSANGGQVVNQGVLASGTEDALPDSTGAASKDDPRAPDPGVTAGSGGGFEESNPKPVGTARAKASAEGATRSLKGVPNVAQPLNVSSGVMAGNLLSSRQPAAPGGFARLFHTQGDVVMRAIISKRGQVQDLRVISGHYALRSAAKDAVRTWRYRPYTVHGIPVEVETIVTVTFGR